MKRLVGFAMVTVCPGRVVILDEPTNDVDPVRRRMPWQQIRDLGNLGVAVFLVTHNVLEAEKAVDRQAIIDNGRLLAEGTPSSMKASDRGHLRLQLMLYPGHNDPELPTFVRRSTRVGHNLLAVIDDAEASHAIGWAQELIGIGVAEEYALSATSLEDAYIQLTGHGSADGDQTGCGWNPQRLLRPVRHGPACRPGPSDAPNSTVTPILIDAKASSQTAAPRAGREAALLVTNNNATEPASAT